MNLLRNVGSVKLKLGLLIVAAVAVSATMSQLGFRLGWPIWLRPVVAAAVSLVMVQILARGMTSPLRQMARAARAMARGDSVEPIRTQSRDEIGQLGQAFNTMTEELGALEAERRALVANAAHELRTPIAGLQATLENVRDGVVEPTPDIVDRLCSQADRLHHLVEDLLDLSRLESDDAPRQVEVVDLAEVAEHAVAAATTDRPEVRPQLAVDGDVRVEGEPRLLDRLVTNVVRNAVVHGEGTDVVVQIRACDARAAITVSDGGPGLRLEDPNRVFDRFVRGDSSRSEDRPGTGLGLAISKAIIDRHAGEISVHDVDPHGCAVEITLPREQHDRVPATR